MKILADNGITAPRGFKAAGVAGGIKTSGKKDLGIVLSDAPAAVAAAFTSNIVAAAPVLISKELLGARARAVIINSGNANACTGPQGLADAETMVEMTAGRFGLEKTDVLLASTGIIGRHMPMEKIEAGIKALRPETGIASDLDFAQAIMTTDAFPKQLAVEIELSGGPVRIGGAAKGAGMIAPALVPHATMIAVVTTDAPLDSVELKSCLTSTVGKSFNAISVDGDMSTNDTVFVLANGMVGRFDFTAADTRVFQEALDYVCLELAKMIVRDGEGATKLITFEVVGAVTDEDAFKVAKTVADSILVKTAFFGRDPNWGRILGAAGRANVPFDPDRVDIDIGGAPIVRDGSGVGGDLCAAAERMKAKEIRVKIDFNQGGGSAVFYGCDLGYDYVKINAEYTT